MTQIGDHRDDARMVGGRRSAPRTLDRCLPELPSFLSPDGSRIPLDRCGEAEISEEPVHDNRAADRLIDAERERR
jgi:hypothetical protein